MNDLESTYGNGFASWGWLHCRIETFDLRVEWHVEPGQVLVLFGPSGAGKTTALRALAGLVRPMEGHVEIGGHVVYDGTSRTWKPAHKRGVGYVTQQCHLFPHLRVADNVAYGLPAGKDPAHVTELLHAFELEGMEQRFPWELSGGQQQRVALARALVTQPGMLLLDEPFVSLDSELRRSVRRELRSVLARKPVPTILVTHDREEALAFGDEVQVIDAGVSVAQGTPLEVLGQPGQARVARLVGVENMFRLEVDARNVRDGTMTCHGGGICLEVPLDDVSQAESREFSRVTVGVRASDIILATSEPIGSSARNRLPGIVTLIEAKPPGYTVTLDCGVPLRCHITGAALDEIGVREGQQLWAVFKASSCFLIEEQ